MNNIKRVFSIKDLENLSGIKAHTIRIWEKRYNLLSPQRTNTNIRSYSIKSLQKLLNITLLYNNGYKISRIADLSESQIITLAKEVISETGVKNKAINDLKIAMVNFDPTLFSKTYHSLLSNKSFSEVFYSVFIPLLHELGLLWQTDTINPAHEHFLSNLIKQKILINTEQTQESTTIISNNTFVLFLPEHEIHEIGLLFLNYEITSRGHHVIYLGPNMPIENLTDLNTYYPSVTFITYFTVAPPVGNITEYLNNFHNLLNQDKDNQLYLLGSRIVDVEESSLPKSITLFKDITDLVKKL